MVAFTEEAIDFSDLEKQYEINPDDGLEAFVVVDGAPVVPQSKVSVLTNVLKKLFSKSGTIVEDGFYMPTDDKGNTKGFIFIEYETTEQALRAIQENNHKKLDKKHTLLVNKLGDVERFGFEGAVETEYKEPEIPPYQERGHLRSWLTDPQGRDQILLQKNKSVEIYWNKKTDSLEPVMDDALKTSTFSRWSPKGTYVVTFHLEGVQIRGAEKFGILGQFPHMKPENVDFSPNEKYLVTFSKEPIVLPPIEDSRARANFPFKEIDEGNNVVIWDVKTCLPLRTFLLSLPAPPDPKKPLSEQRRPKKPWPMFKWSSDDKYFARISNGEKIGAESLQIFESKTMGLIDKKSLKVPGIVDFEFSPSKILLDGNKDPVDVLCYWTPEMANQTARVTIIEVPSKEVIRTRNMFNVSGCQLHWQDDGKYLCVKVDRHTKTRKSTFTNLEFFRLTEKAIPVEVTELKDTVVNFAWEPKGDRFATISRAEIGPQISASGATIQNSNSVSFYALEKNKGAQATWRLLKRLDKKATNSLFWSPRGRFVVTANIGGTGVVELDFYDFDHDGEKRDDLPANIHHLATSEHYGMTDLQWDPSGRYVATYSSVWRSRSGRGYKIWDFRGLQVREEDAEQFGTFQWRPRPDSLLTKEQRKKITKDLKKYSRKFDEEDAMEASEANRELIMRRRAAWEHWKEWRAAMDAKLEADNLPTEQQLAKENEGEEFIEEITEEVLETVEEVVE